MVIRSFFNNRNSEPEKLDVSTVVTIPDQSLTVREILTRFSRGQITIPPIETGDDDDINDLVDSFDDISDASNAFQDAIGNMQNEKAKEAEQSGVTAEQSGALTEDAPQA